MRFLLRLLLLLALGSFLLRHYGSFIRENLWRVHTADQHCTPEPSCWD